MAVITLPNNLDFINWAAQIQRDLPNFQIPNPDPEDQWHLWAEQLLANNQFYTVPLPNKQVYPDKEDWRKWAIYFVNSVIL